MALTRYGHARDRQLLEAGAAQEQPPTFRAQPGLGSSVGSVSAIRSS
jgi:hypothetical protein